MFNSNIWPNSAAYEVYKIQSFEIWVTLTLTFQGHSSQMWWCHWTLYMWFPIDICSNCMSISHRLAVTATQNVFSHLLSLGSNYERLKCTEWPQNDIEYYKAKSIPNWTPFCSMVVRFPTEPLRGHGKNENLLHVIPFRCARKNFNCTWNFTCARNNYYVLT